MDDAFDLSDENLRYLNLHVRNNDATSFLQVFGKVLDDISKGAAREMGKSKGFFDRVKGVFVTQSEDILVQELKNMCKKAKERISNMVESNESDNDIAIGICETALEIKKSFNKLDVKVRHRVLTVIYCFASK